MDNQLYDMIWKRKSFHLFRNTGVIAEHELQLIQDKCSELQSLYPNIRTNIKIVPASETTCKRGEEYCILFYSEPTGNYLSNIGYMGEQLDLYLAQLDIGALWFGMGSPKKPACEGLEFVIMIAIAKMPQNTFRKNMYKSKRKSVEEIWVGEQYKDIADIVRFTPSACNSQPWRVEATEQELCIYRYKKPGKSGIMPAAKITYYNRIDIGIFLCFLELCLTHQDKTFTRELFTDEGDEEQTLVARYGITLL